MSRSPLGNFKTFRPFSFTTFADSDSSGRCGSLAFALKETFLKAVVGMPGMDMTTPWRSPRSSVLDVTANSISSEPTDFLCFCETHITKCVLVSAFMFTTFLCGAAGLSSRFMPQLMFSMPVMATRASPDSADHLSRLG